MLAPLVVSLRQSLLPRPLVLVRAVALVCLSRRSLLLPSARLSERQVLLVLRSVLAVAGVALLWVLVTCTLVPGRVDAGAGQTGSVCPVPQ